MVALGAGVTLRMRGYPEPTRPLVALSTWQYAVVQHAARRIAALDASAITAGAPDPDQTDVAGFVDGWVARMNPRTRRDLLRFLVFVEQVAPLGCGYLGRFTRLDAAAQDQVLASIEGSSHALLRAGFEGLKALVFLGYYRDPRTWSVMGYDGPLLGRPESAPGGAAR
ncbi:MAG TPA: gluconate 2-dehydrogenase subunit 3 family protein [Polyangiaceae bacterium]|nr:gluconate 2-dehydrogenase subunit 3 family protein [Polyangiaceae bacterium]